MDIGLKHIHQNPDRTEVCDGKQRGTVALNKLAGSECPFDHRGLPRGNLLTPIDSLVSTGYRLAIQEAG